MIKYKWSTKDIEADISRLQSLLFDERDVVKYQAYKDLNKILYLLNNSNRFDDESRIQLLKNMIKKSLENCNIYMIENIHSKSDDLKHIQNINIFSLNFLDKLENFSLKRKKYRFNNKVNDLEALFLIRLTLADFDNQIPYCFDDYLSESKISIDNEKGKSRETFVVYLNSLTKAYANVTYKKYEQLDGILYGFFKTLLAESLGERDLSIFNKTIETFFNLLLVDKLKDNEYNSYYNLRINLLNEFKEQLEEFKYISKNTLIYDKETNKYSIKITSSLFDGELASYYSRGVSYKNLMNPIISVYSNLLALALHEKYQTDKKGVQNDIYYLINNIGYENDLIILKHLYPDLSEFTKCDYYNNYINQAKKDYQLLKRK